MAPRERAAVATVTRERTAKVIPITAALAAVREDGTMFDFESITDEDREAWRRRRDAEVARERALGERAAALEGRKRALLAAGFPLRAVEAAIADDGKSACVAFLREWNPADRCIVVLAGANGVGKTVAAAWWALHYTPIPMFVRATTFARSSRYRSGDPSDGGDPGKVKWIEAPSLVFDDVGDEEIDRRESLKTDINELVDTFYGNKKPLIITTNVPSKGTKDTPSFRQRYGARIADRIDESGIFFEDDAPSRRAR